MTDHIVKAYDEELKTLHALIHQMGETTLKQIEYAIQAVMTDDEKLAHDVVNHDDEINHLEIRIDELAVRILALRQPVASDLRTVVAALKVSNQIERIADYAANIAKRTLLLSDMPHLDLLQDLPELIKLPKLMFEKALVAFATHDLNLALHIWHMDREVDENYNAYIKKLFDAMILDPKNVGPCTQYLFAAKNIERIGDQTTNIAEAVYTLVTGKPFKENEME